MSIKLRLALLLGLLLVVFGFCFFALRTLEERQLAEAVAGARRDDADLLEQWIDLRAASLRRFVDDASGWDALADFANAPAAHPAWARENLDPLLTHYGLDALWITAPDGTPVHTASRAGLEKLPVPVPPSRLQDLTGAEIGVRAYFFPSTAGLFEVRAVRLTGPASPWLFSARLWDETYLAHLGNLTDSTATLAAPGASSIAAALQELPTDPDSPAPLVVQRLLSGWDGQPVRVLHLLKDAPGISFRINTDRLKTKVFLFFGICLIASLAVSLHKWVLQPLGWITDSLTHQDPAPVQPLLKARTELTRVAGLIVASFEHNQNLSREIAERRHAETALQRTLQERARLGRDLHDGVIQSIYAAGMGVAAARKRMPADPATAERHLAQVADVLNDTIREVRDFITGLEPETLNDDAFAQTVTRLFATLNAAETARLDLALDHSVASRLPTSLRTELLLIMREAISNALRHGQAGVVTVRIFPDPIDPALAHLDIQDDGQGFDPAHARRGRGLDNLIARAAARGARVKLDSTPGHGTRLAFVFPLSHPSETDDDS